MQLVARHDDKLAQNGDNGGSVGHIAEVRTAQGKLYLSVAINHTSKFVFA
jgi:hypothetical protein